MTTKSKTEIFTLRKKIDNSDNIKELKRAL